MQIQENGGESLILTDRPLRLCDNCAGKYLWRFGDPSNGKKGSGLLSVCLWLS